MIANFLIINLVFMVEFKKWFNNNNKNVPLITVFVCVCLDTSVSNIILGKVVIRARCYRSLRKPEEPHQLEVNAFSI